jgi:hypothetical protein
LPAHILQLYIYMGPRRVDSDRQLPHDKTAAVGGEHHRDPQPLEASLSPRSLPGYRVPTDRYFETL